MNFSLPQFLSAARSAADALVTGQPCEGSHRKQPVWELRACAAECQGVLLAKRKGLLVVVHGAVRSCVSRSLLPLQLAN